MTEDGYQNSLKSIVQNCTIIIDTCSILEPGCGVFLKDIVPYLSSEKKSIMIPTACLSEVEKHRNNPNFNGGNINLDEIINSLNTLKNMGLVRFIGTSSDITGNGATYADSVLVKEVPGIAQNENVLFITQDKILNLKLLLATENYSTSYIAASIDNSTGRIATRKMDDLWEKILKDEERIKASTSISVSEQYKLDEIKALKKNHSVKKLDTSKSSSGKPTTKKSEGIPKNEIFTASRKMKTITGSVPVTSVPGEGDSVYAVRGNSSETIVLTKHIASGGEGSVYATNKNGIVVKIYKPERITRGRFEKLAIMISKDIEYKGICFPIALIYNQNKEFVGFSMKQAKGKPLQSCVFMPMLLQKEFPQWSRKETVLLCITILEKIKYLHDRNVILGDINPLNILVVSPTDVYFVDTDSYQVEGFPCPVGTLVFTAPEIQGGDFGTFLRSKGNENFAIATLLFMIMLPGKAPYAMQGAENMKDSIISMDFAYPLGEQKTGLIAKGKWRFMWSHLAYPVKQAFYLTFSKEKVYNRNNHLIPSHNNEKTRYSVDDWLQFFSDYKSDLPTLKKQDPMSLSLFPTRFKKGMSQTIEECSICGKEFVRDYDQTFTTCFDCSHKERQAKEARHNSTYRNITCAACEKVFAFTYGEKEFYESKGIDPPRRCKECRDRGILPKPKATPLYQRTTPTYQRATQQRAQTTVGSRTQSVPARNNTTQTKQPTTAARSTNAPVVKKAWYQRPGIWVLIVIALIIIISIANSVASASTPESRLGVSTSELQTIPGTALYYAFDEGAANDGWNYNVYSKEHSYNDMTVYLFIYDSDDQNAEAIAHATATIDYSAGSVKRLHFGLPVPLNPHGSYWAAINHIEYDDG
jgi:serine/threonine protein kinase